MNHSINHIAHFLAFAAAGLLACACSSAPTTEGADPDERSQNDTVCGPDEHVENLPNVTLCTRKVASQTTGVITAVWGWSSWIPGWHIQCKVNINCKYTQFANPSPCGASGRLTSGGTCPASAPADTTRQYQYGSTMLMYPHDTWSMDDARALGICSTMWTNGASAIEPELTKECLKGTSNVVGTATCCMRNPGTTAPDASAPDARTSN